MRKKFLIAAGMLAMLFLGACRGDRAEDMMAETEEAETSAGVSASSENETPETQAEGEKAASVFELDVTVESGFYTSDIMIHYELKGDWPANTKVYYTLDGQDPEPIREMHCPAVGIHLTAQETLQVIPLKLLAYARTDDGEKITAECFRNYVLCADESQFPDIKIVSITSDDENLYDYDTGIFVAGRVYDETEQEEDQIPVGNYSMRGDDWVRSAAVTVFGNAGNVINEEKVGLSVSGNSSATQDILRSLKITADPAFGSEDELCYEISDEVPEYADWSFVNEVSAVKLRVGSQDAAHGNLRSAVVSVLSQECGFEGCSDTERCLVYLNGQVYGIADMMQTYSGGSLADKFSLPDSDAVEVWQGFETVCFSEAGDIGSLFETNLNERSNREALEAAVDMENYLYYCAIEILCNNTDWPENNFCAWRYNGTEIPGNEYTDGRLRFLIYDMDYSFTSEMLGEPFDGSAGDTLRAIMQRENRGACSYFYNCMQSTYYRNLFASYICDLLNTTFDPENVEAVILEEDGKIQKARDITAELSRSLNNKHAEKYVTEMISVYENRPEEIRALLDEFMGLSEEKMYSFELTVDSGLQVSFSNQTIAANEIYEVDYYNYATVKLQAEAYPGYEFSHWLVNGVQVEGETLNVYPTIDAQDGAVRIIAVSKKKDTADVVIDRITTRGDYDSAAIRNAGGEAVSLAGLYLTDKASDPTRAALPDIVLQPGEEIILYSADNPDADGDAYVFDFGLSVGEVLYLSDGETLLDSVFVPKLSEGEYYGRVDHGAKWAYIRE